MLLSFYLITVQSYTAVVIHLHVGLCIKEGNKEWKSSLPCSCQNVTEPCLNWVTCVHAEDNSSDIFMPYFLVYRLTKKSSLTKVMKEVRKNHKSIVGLILVNHSNSTSLPDDFGDSDLPRNFLLHVVSQTNGQVLLRLLQRLNVGEVCVSRRIDSSVDESLRTAVGGESIPVCCVIIVCTFVKGGQNVWPWTPRVPVSTGQLPSTLDCLL